MLTCAHCVLSTSNGCQLLMRVSPGVHANHCILHRSHALLKMPCLSSYVLIEAQHSQILGLRIPETIA